MDVVATYLTIGAAAGAAIGLGGTIYSAFRHTSAERALKAEMTRNDKVLQNLANIIAQLEKEKTPDPGELAQAQMLLTLLASYLKDNDRSEIQRTLDRADRRSLLNYISKLVESQQRSAGQPDSGPQASSGQSESE